MAGHGTMREIYLAQADAALSACGYQEMREAMEAVAYFWGTDPKAFGDDATVTSLAGQFAKVADQCRAALSKANPTGGEK